MNTSHSITFTFPLAEKIKSQGTSLCPKGNHSCTGYKICTLSVPVFCYMKLCHYNVQGMKECSELV